MMNEPTLDRRKQLHLDAWRTPTRSAIASSTTLIASISKPFQKEGFGHLSHPDAQRRYAPIPSHSVRPTGCTRGSRGPSRSIGEDMQLWGTGRVLADAPILAFVIAEIRNSSTCCCRLFARWRRSR